MPKTRRRVADPEQAARLYAENQGLVHAFVYRHWGMHAPYWVQDAAMAGYEDACMAYDPSRGRLSTLAWLAMWRQVVMARRAREADMVGHAATLDRPVGDGTDTAMDMRPDPAAAAEMDDALTAMTIRGYRTIGPMLDGWPQTQVASRLGVSQAYVSRLFHGEVRQWARECGVAIDA